MSKQSKKEYLEEEKKRISELLVSYKARLDFGDSSESNNSIEEEADETEELATYLGVRDVLKKRLIRIENELSAL
jgi:RNA polymerase-binding transcription factor DksA